MKQLALILSATSLLISGALCVGAYVTYKKAEVVLNNPEKYINQVVDKVVEDQVSKIIEKLPIPKLNTEKFRLPF
jgi:NAD-dependent SIR2 family protein deacetylase